MAGHRPVVSELHYARLGNTNSASPTLKNLFIQVCKDWHRLHGFQTMYESSGRTKFIPWEPSQHSNNSVANVIHAEPSATSLPDVNNLGVKKQKPRLPYRSCLPISFSLVKCLSSIRTAKTNANKVLKKVIDSESRLVDDLDSLALAVSDWDDTDPESAPAVIIPSNHHPQISPLQLGQFIWRVKQAGDRQMFYQL
jgi:hypothetical protein